MTTLDILIAVRQDVAEAQAWTGSLRHHEMFTAPLAGLDTLIAGERARVMAANRPIRTFMVDLCNPLATEDIADSACLFTSHGMIIE